MSQKTITPFCVDVRQLSNQQLHSLHDRLVRRGANSLTRFQLQPEGSFTYAGVDSCGDTEICNTEIGMRSIFENNLIDYDQVEAFLRGEMLPRR